MSRGKIIYPNIYRNSFAAAFVLARGNSNLKFLGAGSCPSSGGVCEDVAFGVPGRGVDSCPHQALWTTDL